MSLPRGSFVVVLFVVVTDKFVAESLFNWVGTCENLKPVVKSNKVVCLVWRRRNREFSFGVLTNCRNIRKICQCYHVSIGPNKFVNLFNFVFGCLHWDGEIEQKIGYEYDQPTFPRVTHFGLDLSKDIIQGIIGVLKQFNIVFKSSDAV